MGKLLVLMRHGHAEMANDDFDRPLSLRGQEAARTVGKILASDSIAPQQIVASAAQRAAHTAELVVTQLPIAVPIEYRRELYLASAGELLSQLQRVADTVPSLLLVGHNPGLSDLARRLFRHPIALSPAQFLCETLPIAHWRELGASTALGAQHG